MRKEEISKCIEEYCKNNKFNDKQKALIAVGLYEDLDVKYYATERFNELQMSQIYFGLQANLDVSTYANECFNALQMEEIRKGLLSGIDVSKYSDEKYSENQMREIRYCLEQNYTPCLDENKSYDEMYSYRCNQEALRIEQRYLKENQ